MDILQGETVLQNANFAVNLFDFQEQNITHKRRSAWGDNRLNLPDRTSAEQREVWTWFGALAWVILMVEWWIDHRRRGLLAERARVKA
jgi:hypothetical protein